MTRRRHALCALLACAAACGGQQQSGPPTPAQILKQRPYTLRAPPNLSTTTPAPLVIGLHGYGGTSDGFEAEWQLAPAAGDKGVLYVALDGMTDRDGYQRWNAVPLNTLSPYDVLYVSSVIDDVASKYAVDPKRVYAVGFSMGAFMAYRLGCELSSKIAAVVSLSGQSPTADSLCPTSKPVSVLEVHGDHDSDVLYDGSNGASSRDVVESWGERDGCTGKLEATGQTLDIEADLPGAETTVAKVAGCPAGLSAELWTIRGGEHHPNLAAGWNTLVLDWVLAHGR
jgi:polyhydroxybutyrate depolymerase